ncbi:MAG: DUF3656 domain-containing protein, partial [Clostridia bacterium]|nr:DUF3656 domain-containing protein [Clostridia bacterium]
MNEKLLNGKRLLPVKISAEFFAGKRAKISIGKDAFFSESELERANSRPLTKEDIIRNFQKTDGYPFLPEFTDIKTDGVFITAANLNALRRNVYANLYGSLTANKNAQLSPEFVLPQTETGTGAKTAVISTDLKGVKADIGILKLDNVSQDCNALLIDFDGEKYLYVPPYMAGDEVEKISSSAQFFDGIYCDGYFGLALAKRLGKKFFAGTGFNVSNCVSLDGVPAEYI